MFYLGNRSRSRLKGVDPRMIFLAEQSLIYTPIDFGIAYLGGLRTAKQQHQQFLKGASKADGYKVLSKHQAIPRTNGPSYGRAFDFYALINGQPSWDDVHIAIVGSSIVTTAEWLRSQGKFNIKVRWGLTFGSDEFKGWDGGHIEVVEDYDHG